MKWIFPLVLPLFVFSAVHAQQKTIPKTIYQCPMHPEVQRSQPGKCPKCGMDLEKKTIRVAAPKPAPQKPPVKKPAIQKDSLPPKVSEEAPIKKETGIDSTVKAVQPPEAMIIHTIPVILKPGKTVRYDLYLTDTLVNYTGKSKHAYAINGTIPGPELVFTEGDTAEIYLHNRLKKEETSLHWHGVIVPNRFDGVPYLTTAPVMPGEDHLYKFAIVQNGTYWYHSHSGLQEQAGLYGALIFRKREEQKESAYMTAGNATLTASKKPASDSIMNHAGHDMSGMNSMNHGGNHMQAPMPATGNANYNKEQTLVLSEWTNERPEQVQRRLRTVNDWYAIQKGSTQSYSEAIRAGHLNTKIINEWKRMNAMDVSDVYYDRFLVNGAPAQQSSSFHKGDRVRLRLVNAGASTYFWLQYAGGKMTVIANDGNDVIPVEVDRLIIAVSETYDVIVTIPENRSYEFRITPEDRTKAASFWLGTGEKTAAPVLPRLKYFEGMKMMNSMMKMNGDMKAMDMKMSFQQMDMNMVMYDEFNTGGQVDTLMNDTEKADSSEAENMIDMQGVSAGNSSDLVTLNYSMLKATHKTMLPETSTKELFFTLTGNMNRYVWSINNKIVSEWDKIPIAKGQNVRIILFNNSMMRHPMHLHGHDFRVLNGQGEYAPFKNVLDIMPMETDTIEFAGNKDGDWFFHCHILYHMMAGMGNVFSYQNSLPNVELPDKVAAYNRFLRDQKMFHPMAEIGLESNGSDGLLMVSGERFELRTEWRIGLKQMHGNESETYFGRYVGKMQWLFQFVGFDYHKNTHSNETSKNVFDQTSNQSNRKAFVAGVEYTLPMLLRAQARVDSKGKFRFQLGREEVPLTPRLRLSFMANTDKEYMAGFRYIVSKWLALSTHYDSDMGYGAGITLIY